MSVVGSVPLPVALQKVRALQGVHFRENSK